MSEQSERVREFLTQWLTMRGLDPEHITAANHAVLAVGDLVALVECIERIEALASRYENTSPGSWSRPDVIADNLRAILTAPTEARATRGERS